VRPVRSVALAVLALLLAACATGGGPAGTNARSRCSDHGGDPALQPMVFLFCIQSP
jgi:hypothetical protein